MNINFWGPVGPTGYGRFTNYLCPAIKKLGHNISVIPSYLDEMRMAEERLQPLMKTDEKTLDADVAIRLSIGTPSETLSFHGKKRIMYTMLEVDKIPPLWVMSLNRMDAVWTPSTWGKEVFKNSGVKKDIFVVPGGVDQNLFSPWREPLVPKQDKFRFLLVGKWEKRKGYDLAIKAYCEEFNEKEKVELVIVADSIRLFDSQFNIYKQLINFKVPETRADFQIVEGMIPQYSDMGRLYTSADCFVNPTRGEGWNLPLIEAMSCGLPSITTGYGAHMDYANEKNAYLLKKFKMVPADQDFAFTFLQFGKWAEPTIKELREKMRYIFDNKEEAKKLGESASKDMNKWTWDCAAIKAIDALKKI